MASGGLEKSNVNKRLKTGTRCFLQPRLDSKHQDGGTVIIPTYVRTAPPPVELDTRFINLKVNHQDGRESSVRIKRCAQLQKLMTTYYEQENKEYGSVAFLFDGRGARPHQTPQELDMDDGDEIDAMIHQDGGSTLALG